MIDLPQVTLFVLHGGPATKLFQYALEQTLVRINPAEVLIFTHDPTAWRPDHETIRIPHCYSAMQAMYLYWYEIPKRIKTSHMLHVEWDGWVVDESRWSSEFLDYDYIGAPWPWYADSFKVGNGLGLRSTKLMRHLADFPGKYPLPKFEDHTLCRDYRPQLEREGFCWAPVELASRFSWERGPNPGPTFMFHGAFNFPYVLSKQDFETVETLADDYVRGSVAWGELQTGGFL